MAFFKVHYIPRDFSEGTTVRKISAFDITFEIAIKQSYKAI